MRKAGIAQLHVITEPSSTPAAYWDAQAWHTFDDHAMQEHDTSCYVATP